MNYQQTLIQSIKHLKLTLPRMQNLGIPTTPENFSVWYEYSMGSNLALNSEIDDRLNSGKHFTEDFNREIYLRYVLQDHDNDVLNVNAQLNKVVRSMNNLVKIASNDLHDFERSLQSCDDDIRHAASNTGAQEVIQELFVHTQDIKKTNQFLHQTLIKLSDDIDKIKRGLTRSDRNSSVDPLTGAPNRRNFDNVLERYIEYSDISGTPFSVLMVDIDNFKLFNDKFGHMAGDSVVRYVAEKIRRVIRGQDILVRYGGDEFVLVLPETELAGAAKVAKNICHGINQQDIQRDESRGALTVSIGVATYRISETSSELMSRVGQALCNSKNHVRGRAGMADGRMLAELQ